MSRQLTNLMVVCPVCKSSNASVSSKGVILKKTTYECNNCHTTIEQSGKGEDATFVVTRVGEDYSNAESLLAGKRFGIRELGTHELSIVSDAELQEYSEGKFDGLNIHMVGDTPPQIVLKRDERVVLCLSPVKYLEERRQRVVTGGGNFGIRIARGFWYHTPRLYEAHYADSVQLLDSGWLVITNKRYIFLGNRKNIDQSYAKVTAIRPLKDGLGIVRSNKQRTEFFTGGYHWPLIASILLGITKNANIE